MSKLKLSKYSDEELSDLFGEMIAEIAIRTEQTEKQVMYELAKNYWGDEGEKNAE